MSRKTCSRCPVLELPRSLHELEAGLAGKFRYRIRSSHRKLAGLGSLEFETAAPESDAAFLAALFRLHAEHWSHRSESGVLSPQALQSFYRDVARRFRELGWLRLYSLRLDGAPRAVPEQRTRKTTACSSAGLSASIKRIQDHMIVLATLEERHTQRLMRHEEELESLAHAWTKVEAFRIGAEAEISKLRLETEQNLREITDKLNGLIGYIGGSGLGVKQ